MKKTLVLVNIFMLMFLLRALPVQASEVDILVEKLVKKGVLNKQEASEVLQEVKDASWQEKDKERAEIIKGTKDAIKKESPTLFAGEIPEWVRKMQIKGDFRLRYEHSQRDVYKNLHAGTTKYTDRDRYRYRLRLGVVTKVADKIDVGFGLASGSDDPRSTNQTYQQTFSKGDLRIDYAYARYKPFDWLTLIGGKFENPLWTPTDTFWDADIRPDGAAAQINYTVLPSVDLFLTTGWFILDELPNDSNDPSMWVFQPGSKIKFGDAYFKNAVSYYSFDCVKDHTFPNWSAKSNTLRKLNAGVKNGTLRYDYNNFVLSGEFGSKLPLTFMPFAAVFGEYLKNTDGPGSADTGYVYGIKFGHEKVTKEREWQFLARYERLERDAWLDFLPDSDTYGGQTDVKGTKFQFTYGIIKNVNVVGTYFNSEKLHGGNREEDLWQIDLNYKF
ncbi:MAG: putative porin [Pseudomonadota bacterium]